MPPRLMSAAVISTLHVAIAGLVLAVASRAAAAEPQQIRIATLAPSGSPWMELLERGAAEIASRTDRRVTIKYYTGGQQGDERDFIRKIKARQLDGAAVTSMGLAMIEPSIRVLELPMLFRSREEVDYVASKMWPYFQAKFAKQGFRLSERGEIGWVHFFSKTKVTSLAELRKQKLCAVGEDLLGKTLVDKLNLQAVPLGIPEVDGALATGRIDACFSSPLGAIVLQWYTKLRYMSSTPMVYAIGATVMSLDAVSRVAPEDRRIIEAIAKAGQKKARTVIRRANDDARSVILRKGITLVDAPQAMVDELTAVAAEVQRELTGKLYSKDELATAIAYRDEYRATRAKRAK